MILTAAELKEIREREKRATPGEWKHEMSPAVPGPASLIVGVQADVMIAMGMWSDNGTFMAHARADIPTLLKALELVQGELATTIRVHHGRASMVAQSPTICDCSTCLRYRQALRDTGREVTDGKY